MMNFKVGERVEIDGATYIQTKRGVAGHAIYGPYQVYPPGQYAVEFFIMTNDELGSEPYENCGGVDVHSASLGALADHTFYKYNFANGHLKIRLKFVLNEAASLEFRVYTSGSISLIVAERYLLVNVPSGTENLAPLFESVAFPDPAIVPKPKIFLDNVKMLRRLHDRGAQIKFIDGSVVAVIRGITISAETWDDIRFVEEVYVQNTYNFRAKSNVVVIDIGMNVGLSSLLFASKPYVNSVISFEPFRTTYERALRNISLNPDLAPKITTHNYGLSDENSERTILIPDGSESGSRTIRGADYGAPVTIKIRQAAEILRPILKDAERRGLAVIVKVDCEGAEFEVFRSLGAAGLMSSIAAFMVEWHRGHGVYTQNDLIGPLEQHGFIVFDLTVDDGGNGFFYGAKISS
jgi:FkbM family methyltransferase